MTPFQTDAVIPLTPEKLTYWRKEIERARQMRKDVAARYGWDSNLARYEPQHRKSTSDGNTITPSINTGVDFADVERKKAALLFDTPSVALTTTIPGRETIVGIHADLLNRMLGPQHANLKPTSLKAIFNCLCPSGVGPVVVGYTCTKQMTPVAVPVQGPDGQPMIGLDGQIVTQPQLVPIPIAEEWFASDFSPKALLAPADLRDTDYQKSAAWMGMDWRKPVSQLRREHDLPADWQPTLSDAERPYFRSDEQQSTEDTAGDPPVSGVEIWYRAELDAQPGQTVHPKLLRQLVLVDGMERPLVHRDSPHQTLITEGPDAGRLTPDSLIGFPIRPLILRDLTDSFWIPSDCAETAALTHEQAEYRRIALEKRDTNRNVILFDATKITPDTKDKIERGETGSYIPVQAGALAAGKDAIMAQVAQISQGREAYLDQDLIRQDRANVLGMDHNQYGTKGPTSKTATESAIVQRNTDARFEQERQRTIEWVLDVVRAFDTLLVRYGDLRLATMMLGPERGKAWADAKQQGMLAGSYDHSVQIDAGKYLDVEADRRQKLQFYSQVRPDPNVNPRPLLKDIAELFGYDPNEFVTEPPPKGPDSPRVSITISADNFNPQLPQFPIVVEIARQGGYQISADAIKLAQQQASQMAQLLSGTGVPVSGAAPDPRAPQGPPQHPGAAPQQPSLSKHLMEETGQMSGPGPVM